MATFWPAKGPDDVVRYSWRPPLVDGDTVAEATLLVTGGAANVDALSHDGQEVIAFISAGDLGTATFTCEVVSTEGEEFTETIYLPIVSPSNALSTTAGDVVSFALRKVIGFGESADASELLDGLEWLNDMLSEWKAEGADVGIVLPLVSSDVLRISDAFIGAIKHNLTIRLADNYGRELSPVTVAMARTGLQRIKTALLPEDRAPAEYY